MVGFDHESRQYLACKEATAPNMRTTFKQYISYLEPWDRHLLQDNQTIDHTTLTDNIPTESMCTIVSDGGMADGYGSFGWAISIDHNTLLGRGEAQGQRDLMQSFRAEGYGMLSALRFLLHACTYSNTWPQHKKTIKTYCDNLGLIQRLRWHGKRTTTTPKNASAPDYDIEISITTTIDQLAAHNIVIQPLHVRGHQDKHKKYHQLSREEQLNVDADGEATAALRFHRKTEEYHTLEHANTMLYIEGRPVTSNEANTIRTAYLSKLLRKHMIQREQWQAHVPDLINWAAHKRSLNKLNKMDKTRIHKFLHRCLPTNKK